jgi:hypothetical protein
MIGEACVRASPVPGSDVFALASDRGCFLPGAIIGGIGLAALLAMLRRGAAIVPRLTLLYAGIAVAALANLGLLLFHAGDASIMLLAWHGGYVAALAAAGAWAGPAVLRWRLPEA